MANEVTVWNKVMSSALAIPGVQVDRETFLDQNFDSIALKMNWRRLSQIQLMSFRKIE